MLSGSTYSLFALVALAELAVLAAAEELAALDWPELAVAFPEFEVVEAPWDAVVEAPGAADDAALLDVPVEPKPPNTIRMTATATAATTAMMPTIRPVWLFGCGCGCWPYCGYATGAAYVCGCGAV